MKKWYGSVMNRLEENGMYCDEIKVGTGMTEYGWSDRKPYEVIKVIDQKHIVVRALDHEKADDKPMSNHWILKSNEFNREIEMVYRYNHWSKVWTRTGGQKYYEKVNVSFGVAEYYYDYSF